MSELIKAVQSFVAWASAPPQVDQVTTLASSYVFSLIVISLLGILIVMLFVLPRTLMQRGWLSLAVAFNLIVWHRLYLYVTERIMLPHPWALIFWSTMGCFLLYFIYAFHVTWVVGAFGRVGYPKLVGSVLAVLAAGFFMALRISGIWH